MTYLITGANGFVGQYLIQQLKTEAVGHIVGTYRTQPSMSEEKGLTFEQLDLNDITRLVKIVFTYRPQYIIHLAAESSVGYSWQSPIQSFNNNINIFLNVLEAVRTTKTPCRILSIGSSESYGIVDHKNLPLSEKAPLNPISPYAVARVSQELLSKVYVGGCGLDIILTRSFNHFGPHQSTRFAIPSFAQQIIDRKQTQSTEPIEVGNLSIVRDFLDVRDVVKAYILLLEKGHVGGIYNVCSGTGYSLQQIVNFLAELVGIDIQTKTNPHFIRPNDNPIIIGDNQKIIEEIGWRPSIEIKQSLRDTLEALCQKDFPLALATLFIACLPFITALYAS